jgi:hypothetical protein
MVRKRFKFVSPDMNKKIYVNHLISLLASMGQEEREWSLLPKFWLLGRLPRNLFLYHLIRSMSRNWHGLSI